LAYLPPANSIFLSEQTSHHQPTSSTFSQNKPVPTISHQPNEEADNSTDKLVMDYFTWSLKNVAWV
jgi:hypothetical protein